jgi:hypothetical protein
MWHKGHDARSLRFNELTAYLMKEHRIHLRSRYVPDEFTPFGITRPGIVRSTF